MKYPILQISEANWKKIQEFDVEYSDTITIISTTALTENFINSEYIDSDGYVYKVSDYKTIGFFSSIFKYIPLIPFKAQLLFNKTGKSQSIEELRDLILNRIKDNLDYKDLEDHIKKAKTYAQLMGEN